MLGAFRLKAALVAAAVAAAGHLPAHATDPLQHSFAMPMGLEADSNPALAASGRSVLRWRAAPEYTVSGKGGAQEWSLTAAGTLERSSDPVVSAHRNDPSLRMTWQQSGPNHVLGINAAYVQASTRATEFDQTGVVAVDRTQTTQTLGTTWRQALTERSSLNASVSHQSVGYDTAALTPYSTTSGSLGWSYDLSDKEALSLALNASHYNPGSGGLLPAVAASQSGVLLGYASSLSPHWQWQVQGGVVRISGSGADTSWQGSVQLTHKGQRTDTTFSLGRTVVTSAAFTGFAPSDALRVRWSYALDESSSLQWGVAHTRTQATALPDSAVTTWSAGYSTELSPFWRAGINLQYKTAQRFTGQVNAHVIGATLTYTHPDF